jgi:hypothetical protein
MCLLLHDTETSPGHSRLSLETQFTLPFGKPKDWASRVAEELRATASWNDERVLEELLRLRAARDEVWYGDEEKLAALVAALVAVPGG